ncbi:MULTISPECIES: c-type cytochrome biogenesis protein CcmI [unclassified Rhizobium]|jgi:cytochrome c-type biogenesis protein CcmH|uniref:c-type cytochrome biogenesis protein CcmI n=1 Tax=unclassified Rhizobium TaxID=2613769 RepID=UPI000DDAE2E3|nr:c-type cytochrome biogenesis protein CcmI [Rhizobium sp. UBA1881]
MTFWILLAVMTASVAALLLYPLLRGSKATGDSRAGETAVYRDQLAELDRDRAGGLISAEEAEYARAEIGRRLLAVSSAETSAAPKAGRGYRRAAEVFVLMLLPLTGLCLYIIMGRPDLPSQPLEARLENPGNDMAILVAKAERHLAENPDDGKGWDILAPIYFNTMRIADAETAYRNAIRLLGETAARLDGLAETLIAASSGVITDDARDVLTRSLKLEPENPRARFYIALGLEQAGKAEEARAGFEAIAKQSPPDAPWMPLVSEHIAKNGGTPAAGNAPTAAAALGGPTQADVAAADQMNSGDRQQMIRGMVDSLDAKLTENPDNLDGWLRLVRSYMVLNDKDRAAAALKRGLTAFPADGEKGKQLVALAHELGLPADAAATQGTMQ